MTRLLLGGVLGGIAMWFIGFIFWGTPLNQIALKSADDSVSASLQASLRDQLGATGTGAYPIPWPGTSTGTTLYGQGPTSMVFFNSSGFPVMDSASLIGGLVLAIVCSLLIAFALRAAATHLDFSGRLKLVLLFSLAITAYVDLGQPIFNHMPWSYFIYLWISDLLSFAAAGALIARWFIAQPKVVREV